jgi:hypothetical protein
MRLFDTFNSNADRNEYAEDCKGKVVLVHVIKARGGGGKTPLIPKLGTEWKRVAKCTPQSL